MMRIAGASVLFATLVATTACGVGDDSGTVSDDRNTKLGIVCSASFKMSGTFTPGTPARPIDPDTTLPLTGCWPVGTWNFTATVDTNDCKTPPAVLPSYSFRVDRMEGADMQGLVDTYANLTSISGMKWHLSVSSNGQGCEGNFELGSADGKNYWNMQPVLSNAPDGAPPTTTITGNGDFDQYNADGWPWKPAP
jgi:hypothetical protein